MKTPAAPDPGRASPRPAVRLALLLALAAVVAGLPGLGEVGITWDEPHYFASVERIQDWTVRAVSSEWRETLSPGAIRDAWDADRYHNPHPPFYKIGMAITNALFERPLGLPASYRLSSLLAFGLLVGLVTGITAALARPAAGLGAGLSVLLMPRMLGHAHIGATDMLLTALWFAATMGLFAYVRGGRRRWLALAGIALGLALATKFTAFLLPAPLTVWLLLQERTRRSTAALFYGAALALLTAIVVNPAAWPDPLGYQTRLIDESLARDSIIPISTHYLGRSFDYVLPWHHAVVMTAATLPIATVALATLALGTVARSGAARPLALLCVIQVAFWWALMALPGSPNHDGVRLWLPMFPFMAVLAGIGFGILAGALRRRLAGAAATAGLLALGTLFFLPPALATLGASPYYLSYYGELIGGAAGADRRGMEATYWFDAVSASFRARLAEQLPHGALVVAHPNPEYYEQLQGMGLIRSDLRFTGEPPADYLLLLGRKAMFDRRWNAVYRQARPLLAAELDGVELVGLYAWDESRIEAGDPAAGEGP